MTDVTYIDSSVEWRRIYVLIKAPFQKKEEKK